MSDLLGKINFLPEYYEPSIILSDFSENNDLNLDLPNFDSNYYDDIKNSKNQYNDENSMDEDNDYMNAYFITKSSTLYKRKKIFNIFKEKKKQKPTIKIIGRKKKIDITRNGNDDYDNNKEYHSKMKEDNLIQKIKVVFVNSSMNFINKRHKNYKIKINQKYERLVYKIKSEFAQVIKKDENLKFLQTSIRDLFSSDLSEKYSKQIKDFNRNQIAQLYRDNKEKEVIEILDKTVNCLLNDYAEGKYKDEGFSLDIDLNEIKEKMEKNNEKNINNYIQEYKAKVKDFGNIFEKKISRNRKPLGNNVC
jgi:hypothetical protein